MQYVIGILIGFLIYHYYPTQVEGVTKQANSVVHKSASEIAKATEPTLYDQAKQKIEELSK
jgi:hypothetical protein